MHLICWQNFKLECTTFFVNKTCWEWKIVLIRRSAERENKVDEKELLAKCNAWTARGLSQSKINIYQPSLGTAELIVAMIKMNHIQLWIKAVIFFHHLSVLLTKSNWWEMSSCLICMYNAYSISNWRTKSIFFVCVSMKVN